MTEFTLVESFPEVIVVDGVAVTTSLEIAQYFGKSHEEILADIRMLDISDLLREPNLRESQYTPEGQTHPIPMYYLTKDGFFLLMLFGVSCRGYPQLCQAYILAFDYAVNPSRKPQGEFSPPMTDETGQDTLENPQVCIVDGTAVTTSLEVAKYFDKQHKNVLQSIKEVDCSEEFGRLNFQPSSYLNQQGKQQPMYHITKDGFIFLTMGFTGQKAAQIKEAYIRAFNRMEAQLIARQTKGNSDYSLFKMQLRVELAEMTIVRYQQKYENYKRMYERMAQESIETVSRIYRLCKQGFSQAEIATMTHYREDVIALAISLKPF
jgi:Rha family phage regulatory protein